MNDDRSIERLFGSGPYQPERSQGPADYMPTLRAITAAGNNRLFGDWSTAAKAPDAEIRFGLVALRSRARDLALSDPYGRQFLRMMRNNVVGPEGFRLQAKVKMKRGTKLDDAANELIESKWNDFSKLANASVTGQLSMREVDNLLMTYLARDGEFYLRFLISPDFKYGVTLQVIPCELIDHRVNRQVNPTTVIKMGVELNQWRRPLAYWIRQESNAQILWDSGVFGGGEIASIPASQMLGRFIPEYANQTRGISWLVAAMVRLKMLSGYEEAALVNARASASKMGFVKSETGEEWEGQGEDEQGNVLTTTQPGTIETLPVGADFISYDPKYPDGQHEMFTKTILRGVASGTGTCYNMLANNLEGVNFSSIRAGLLEARDEYKVIQNYFIESVKDVVYERWLELAVLSGQLPIEWIADLDRYKAHKFYGHRWPWVDPLKDMQAALLSIKGGLSSFSGEIAETGQDIDEVVTQLESDYALYAAHNVPIDLSASKSSLVSDTQPTDPNADTSPAGGNGKASHELETQIRSLTHE